MPENNFLKDFSRIFEEKSKIDENSLLDPLGFIIGGEIKKSSDFIDVIYPYTDERFASVYSASESDAEDAIISSQKGFLKTKKLKSYQKRRILEKLSDLICEHKDLFVEILIKEGGKVRDLSSAEVERAVETIKISAEESVRMDGDIISLDRTIQGEDHTGLIRRFPIGTVLAITPFNYPLNLACHKIGPAIAAGNSFILKPASKTPLSALLLGHLLIKTGYPKDAVNVIPCSSKTAENMVTDDRISYLSFTGSPAVGWHLKSVAGRKKAGLELGGNAAVIVHSDADLNYAAEKITTGALANAGQVCISVQRIFAHKKIYEELLKSLKERFEKVIPGDPERSGVMLGPLISKDALKEALSKIDEAEQNGAKILCGKKFENNFLYPTLISDASIELAVSQTEIFAPAATISPYNTLEEAIEKINNSPFGLQAGIFTKDIGNIRFFYEETYAGGIIVNDIPTYRVDCMPYGGVKMSGSGREGPRYAIREMTEEKLLVINNP
ncbi:aldehyde dehydrogenase family protein [Methanomicrobium antiquum]|uniref:Aldehyde dehydrogenase family protein n=1 Tax=Methanomicrobium antiquum TaxID=487686 RepID=A0AAF0FQ22_9EURY|nr:aldehyde dehydrogenase family protein [Methanomicrobium antiquum]WFN35826.1 aldehyde dehydrogenase family protein [Methanomicrobium antiquum]